MVRRAFWASCALALWALVAAASASGQAAPPDSDFAVVTLAMAISRRVSLPMIGAILAWVCAFLVNAVAVASLYQWDETSRERWLASVWSEYRDAPEYVPPMTESTIKPGQIPNATMIIIPEVPAVRLSAQGGTASESRRADGGALVVAKSPAPASLTLRRFYFPHWQVTTPDGKPVPVRRGELGLLAWDIPAGASRYVVSGGPVSGERLGNLVSLVALALLLLTGLAAATSTIRRDIRMNSR